MNSKFMGEMRPVSSGQESGIWVLGGGLNGAGNFWETKLQVAGQKIISIPLEVETPV